MRQGGALRIQSGGKSPWSSERSFKLPPFLDCALAIEFDYHNMTNQNCNIAIQPHSRNGDRDEPA
jgi:hypothetical protein